MSLWVFRGSKIFSRGYFLGLKFFLVGISWVQNFSRGYFVGPKFFLVGIRGSKLFLAGIRGSKIFSRGYFAGPKFFSRVFRGCEIFSREYFVGPYFFCGWFRDSKISSCYLHEQEWQKKKYKSTSQTTYSFLNRFQQWSIDYIRKMLHLLNYLGYYAALSCSNCIFRHLFFFSIRIFSLIIVINSYCSYLAYSFTDYSKFLIDNSPYSPPGENPSGFFSFRSI